ncbi:hypothetical protein A1Q1_02537 [Trichosporon asahii var. asahii CBS 2479]|uniref:Ubiquitin-like domain-containing protein n=1 Tax=Trichosporon asahii var. asahii (strain ATCC 90039 / CBS 2479 / JCM 2466 / KCTC 7840 / NBRC 103889/ NCYC 2677 / UAMH 7654) TaxID=1186058 RepID=J4UBW9_TRIAS|nr:hypothetical protein A1Q1_02537 [Trichosporon asahii var. asahii CBS 2479]EJT48405.1 hypothetical protein A1Q1_02537 [Trichosporon asahii var. asahii CBS 2479]
MPPSHAQPTAAANGTAAGLNARRPSKIKRAASRFKTLFRRKKNNQETVPEQNTPQRNRTTQANASGVVAKQVAARDQTSTEAAARSSPARPEDPSPSLPAETLISETQANGLIQLNVRMEARQKRKRYYVDAAECPISLIKATFAEDLNLDGGAQALTLRFDGHRLRDDSTPGQYDMESGDLIDAFYKDS